MTVGGLRLIAGSAGVAVVLHLLAGSAPAGGTICGTTGPDVIVGDLPDVANYASAGGIEAISVATTSCNVGDQDLSWIDSSNAHPVIAQNLYRLRSGRFEQIGQSWLKHGFFALQLDACGCGCDPAATGSALGVGCSDPYAAPRNGTQNNLGPKSQVNADNGDFPYPPANPPWSGSVDRRLQVRISDLDPAQDGGGLYFVEGQYVAADDAAWGNQNNNASYRRISFSGAGSSWSASLSGMPATEREQPGIRAWQDNDPTVFETDVQIPNEGLVILAAKATDLGGGVYEYEYALQNLNSDRSVGSFSVPVNDAIAVTDAGFHDVDHHSGEPYGGTDWPDVVSSGAVTWATEDFLSNASANAIRWGTLYNFRFRTAAPPITTTVTIGLFKPGTPNAVTATTVGPQTSVGPADCNSNGVDDVDDIANGTSQDCNGNLVPDDCELFPEAPLRSALVTSGLSQPVGASAPAGDFGRLFVVEQTGRIRIVDLSDGSVNATPFLDLSSLVTIGGERGLLGLAFHPDYATNGRFFVNYTNAASNTVIAEYAVSANPDVADAGSAVILRTITQDFANHNGGHLAFGPDDKLYIGMGDGGSGGDPLNRSQDDGSLLGKMLRLDVDNAPTYLPSDNPASMPLPEVWAKGLRNPWQFTFDRLTGDLYIADVGQDGWEEIDFQPAGSAGGENYGWRCYEGNAAFDLGGCAGPGAYVFPIHEVSHVDAGTCSITGGFVYRGCAIPDLSGTYFFADFCGDWIRSLRYDGSVVSDVRDRTTELAFGGSPISSIVSFAEDAAGELYIISIGGSLYRIEADDPAVSICGNGAVEFGEECDPPDGENCDCNCQLVECLEVFADDFEANLGWSTEIIGASSGHWQRGTPVNDAGWEYDPVADGDGSGQCWLTQNELGNTDVDAGAVRLVSPALDLTGGGATIAYTYYLNLTDEDGSDQLLVEISENDLAGPWTAIAAHTTNGGLAWRDHAITEADLAVLGVTVSSTMRIRFTANDGGTASIVEAGVDGFSICLAQGFADCNANCVDDAIDLVNGTSLDCNGNGIPDECEASGADNYAVPVAPPLAIPDGTGAFVADTFTVPVSGTMDDLDVELTINHTWNGDVTVRLSHAGTTVVLIDRPGYTDSGFGFDNDGFDIVLDDEGAGGAIEGVDSAAGVISPPSYVPHEALSAFDGHDIAGVWTIEVSDSEGADTGELSYWGLRFSVQGTMPDPCDCNGNGVADDIDLASATSADCNGNLTPDECDIATGLEEDFDGGPTGVIGAGETTVETLCFGCHGLNGAGGPMLPGPNLRGKSRVEIWNKLLPPTDHPGGAQPGFTQQDFADLEAFLSDRGSRGRPDLVPDSCQVLPDCDSDGTNDGRELEKGTQVDLDYDGTPDDCENPCPWDLDTNSGVGFADLSLLLNVWGPCPGCPEDFDGNDSVGFAELSELLANWGACP